MSGNERDAFFSLETAFVFRLERVLRSHLQLEWGADVGSSPVECSVRQVERSERGERCLANTPTRTQRGRAAFVRAHPKRKIFGVPHVEHLENESDLMSFADFEVPA